MEAAQPNLTLRDYLEPIRSRWWLVVLIVLVTTAGAYAYQSAQPKAYLASTKLYINQTAEAVLGASATTNPESIADEATLLESSATAAQVAKSLGVSVGGLDGSVSAAPIVLSDFIEVTAKSRSADRAVTLANAFARQFVMITRSRQENEASTAIAALRRQLTRLPFGAQNAATRESLQAQVEQLEAVAAVGLNNVEQVDPAAGATDTSKSPLEIAILAGVVGLIGSVLLTYMLFRLDPKLQNVDEAGALYDGPVLAAIPHDPEVAGLTADGMPTLSARSREGFRQLRLSLDLIAGRDNSFKTILVTSASPSEGKTTLARNLALAYSELGPGVALVDCDLRRPKLGRSLGSNVDIGLTDVLRGTATLDEISVKINCITASGTGDTADARSVGANGLTPGLTSRSSVTFIGAGRTPPNPAAMTESDEFLTQLNAVRSRHRVVILDTAPLTAVADTMPLLDFADAVVLVTRTGRTDRRSIKLAARLLRQVEKANVVGVVVNDLTTSAAYGYGYGYGYGYYDEETQSKRRRVGQP